MVGVCGEIEMMLQKGRERGRKVGAKIETTTEPQIKKINSQIYTSNQ